MSKPRFLIPMMFGLLVAVVGVAIGARAVLGGDDGSTYRLDVSLAEVTAANRLIPTAATCPSGGRLPDGEAPPLAGADYVPAGDRTVSALVAPGQVIAFQFLVEAGQDAPPAGSVDFQVAWDQGSQRDPALDANQKVVCAFVDPSDLSTNDGGTAAAASWSELPPSGAASIDANIVVDGVDPGDRLVVEVWLVTRNTLPSTSAPLRARFVSASADGTVAFVRDELPFRLEYFDRTEPPTLTLKVDDSPRPDVNRAEKIVFAMTVTNTSTRAVAPAARLDVFLDPNTRLLGELEVVDSQGSPTVCEPGDDGFSCHLGFVNPGEVVDVVAEVGILPETERRHTREDGGCEGLVDVCTQAVLTWKQSEATEGVVRIEEPSDVPSEQPLSISRLLDAPAPYAYPGERVTVIYAVSNASSQVYNQLRVTDSTCSPVEYVSGDLDGDGRLDPGETWRYECTIDRMDSRLAVSEARVEALLDDGAPRSATAVTQITLISPKLTLRVSDDAGDPNRRRLEVRNEGDADFEEPAVFTTNCSNVTLVRGDEDGDRKLKPGQTWAFACTVDNPTQPIKARAYALDPLGRAGTAVPETL